MTDREFIHQMVDKVLDVQEQTGHFVSIEFKNYGSDINVWVIKGGWDAGKDFDLVRSFDREDIDRFRAVMAYLDGLLTEKDPGGGNRKEVQVTNNESHL